MVDRTGQTVVEHLVVGINLTESRTRNFAEELRRRGYRVPEFRIARAGDLLESLPRLVPDVVRAKFVLMGPSIPWGIAATYLARVLRTPVVIDCPMDITEWPFAQAPRARWLARLLLRSASRVLTIETRSYLRGKLRLKERSLVLVESCADEKAIREAEQRSSSLAIPADAFVVCCSGGALQHRLDRFLPVFEKLAALVPEALLLVICDPLQPLATATLEAAKRPDLAKRIILSPVIKPVEAFFATMARVDLWVATLGDDNVQGTQEFRMELIEAGHLGKPVAATKTAGLLHHGLQDGKTVIYLDPSDPVSAAKKLASLAADPDRLRAMGANLRELVRIRYRLSVAVDKIIRSLEGTDVPVPKR